jgi:hypothetical protein
MTSQELDELAINTIRTLSIDAVECAKMPVEPDTESGRRC